HEDERRRGGAARRRERTVVAQAEVAPEPVQRALHLDREEHLSRCVSMNLLDDPSTLGQPAPVKTRGEPTATDREPTYSLGAVARLTGLSQHVLRAWERRYGAVTPVRSPGGTRRYRESDVERLRLLRAAVAAGHPISEVAREDDDALARRLLGAPPPPP